MSALHEDRPRDLAALRALVAEKFPPAVATRAGRLSTGCASLDRRGGLQRGSLTEVCGSTGGGQLVLAALLEAATREGFYLSLIDGGDAFEPSDWPQSHLDRLLWVRSPEVESALKAADILLRDGNLPVLLLDLQGVSARRLRGIPVVTWHRFQRVIETTATILLVLTPRPMVESVPCRIAVRLTAPWQALSEPRARLLENLETQIFERGREELKEFEEFKISA